MTQGMLDDAKKNTQNKREYTAVSHRKSQPMDP